MKKNYLFLATALGIVAILILVFMNYNFKANSLKLFKNEKTSENYTLVKSIFDDDCRIEFKENKLCFYYRNKNHNDDSLIINFKNSKDYKDVLYLDTAGYLYITNDLRNSEKVFTSKCKSGIADLEGNVLLKAIYDRIYVYDQTVKGYVVTETDRKLGLADKTGKIAAKNEYDKIYEDFTNQGLVAILLKDSEFFSLDKNYKISKIDTNKTDFKDKWENYSIISEASKDKLLGYTLYPIFNKDLYDFYDNLNKNELYEELYKFINFEPNFKSYVLTLNKMYPNNKYEMLSHYDYEYSESRISYFSKITNKIYAFLYSLFTTADRSPEEHHTHLIVCDNKLNIIDANNLNISDSKFEFYKTVDVLSENLISVSQNEMSSKFNPTNKFLLEYELISDSNDRVEFDQNMMAFYHYFQNNSFYKINDNGIILKLNRDEISKRKYFKSQYLNLNDTLLQVPNYYENSEGPVLIYRTYNKQEIQEMLEEILVDNNHDESKLNEIDRYNVKFLRDKIANGISKIEVTK